MFSTVLASTVQDSSHLGTNMLGVLAMLVSGCASIIIMMHHHDAS